MTNYPLEKYRFYIGENKVIAVSTYEGRRVRGIAKCDPRDTFDIEHGKALAAARCNEKVAIKRRKRAYKEADKALAAYEQAKRRYNSMLAYVSDSVCAEEEASNQVKHLLESL